MIQTRARLLARLLTGSTYVLLGYDALRGPGARVGLAGPTLAAMRRVLPLPSDDELVVRGNAAVQTLAGAALVAGMSQRPAALALVGSLVPTTIAGSEASGPNAPPLSSSGAPGLGDEMNTLGTRAVPDTEAPHSQPCVKFQAAWTPTDTQIRPVSR